MARRHIEARDTALDVVVERYMEPYDPHNDPNDEF